MMLNNHPAQQRTEHLWNVGCDTPIETHPHRTMFLINIVRYETNRPQLNRTETEE